MSGGYERGEGECYGKGPHGVEKRRMDCGILIKESELLKSGTGEQEGKKPPGRERMV